MSGTVPNPYAATCQVTLDLPCEVAELLAAHGPKLIAAIAKAVEKRKADARRSTEVRQLLDKQSEDNRVEWAALARRCEAEIARRSNGPGQRERLMKQLATELNVTVSFLRTVCKVQRRNEAEQQSAAVVRLYFNGLSNKRIAADLGITPDTVARVLRSQKDLIKKLRASEPAGTRGAP